jgi:hypothetical protein
VIVMPLVQERRGRSAGHARGDGVTDGRRAGRWATGRQGDGVTAVTGGSSGDDDGAGDGNAGGNGW